MSKTNKTVYLAVFVLAVALFLAISADVQANGAHMPFVRMTSALLG